MHKVENKADPWLFYMKMCKMVAYGRYFRELHVLVAFVQYFRELHEMCAQRVVFHILSKRAIIYWPKG